MDEEKNEQNSDVNSSDKELVKEGAKTAANTYAGPAGGAAVDALSKTKLGNAVLEKGAKDVKKLRTKIIISAIITLVPTFLLLFTLFMCVFFVLGIFDESSSSAGGACFSIPNGEVTALFDNSFTREQFVSTVKAQEGNDVKGETGHTHRWGYEKYYKPNAENFYDISTKYNLDPRFLFALSLNESGWGTSHITVDKGNLFGYGANDSNPYGDAYTFDSMAQGIETVCKQLANNYIAETGKYHDKIVKNGYDPRTLRGIFSVYSTDKKEADTVASIMQKIFGVTATNSNCNGNFQPLTEYNLKHKGLKPLDTRLDSNQINAINKLIETEVDKAGYGTGAGVAAAGQSLVYGLEKFGVYLRYKYGAKNITLGASPTWSGYNTMDCSGFVSWAIKNGCRSSYGGQGSAGYASTGKKINIKDAKPGDVMVTYGKGHVRLVIKNNGDGTVIVAEETSSGGGLKFDLKSAESHKYQFRDMSDWYARNCNKSR